MIVPMIKYGFLVYHRDFDSFLTNLQELGVVDIIKQIHTPTEQEKGMLSLVNRYTAAVNALSSRSTSDIISQDVNLEDVLKEFEDIQKEHEQLEISIRKAYKDLSDARPWGEFDPKTVKAIEDRGIKMRFLIASEKGFSQEWAAENPVEVLLRQAGNVYFVLVVHGEEIEVPFDVQEIKLPTFSFQQKEADIEEYRQRLLAIEKRYTELASYIPAMEIEKGKLLNSLDFISVHTSAERKADDTLMILQGWIPVTKNDSLIEFLEKESITYVSEKAQLHDDAPIMLKNNKFAKLFEPIGNLFTSPIYSEMDLTPFFAPFFMMFFGFCLGDAGYGLILILIATGVKLKGDKKLRPLMSLVQWLGLSTIIFGVLTGTLFGINLVESEIPFLETFKGYFLNNDNLFMLALSVGALQILFGMFVKAFNQIKMWGWMHSITTFSWILLLVGSAVFFGLSKMEGSNVELLGTTHMVLLGVAGIGILFFNSPGKNPFVNFGLGLWNIYNMVTGLFGDVLSYIRLFALGLSSAILGSVFNSLAFGLSPDIPVVGAIVTILILIIGHSINLFMSALGSLVHPMRLTFVEFYKNAGFIGGGKAYQPFSKQEVSKII
ncbi:MAG: V-type ATP synthase subunit I [Bacteroidetes bacterium HGW-Bacteroidetes-15]|nr:MAG: V-type ATP synthase subunit I [Bacteroidetes bacterium HGW-Bacteroidetes-15]